MGHHLNKFCVQSLNINIMSCSEIRQSLVVFTSQMLPGLYGGAGLSTDVKTSSDLLASSRKKKLHRTSSDVSGYRLL